MSTLYGGALRSCSPELDMEIASNSMLRDASLQLPHHLEAQHLEAQHLEVQSDDPRLITHDVSHELNKTTLSSGGGGGGGGGERASNAETPVYIIGIPLHRLSRPVQFAVCFSGITLFYLLYGYSQEWIFRVKEFKLFGVYLTLVQFSFYSLFGLVERQIRKDSKRRIPFTTYVLIAFLTVATMGLSNTSLGYLNYPTQILFKSCKLIPVMIGGVLIQGKKYTVLNYIAVSLMCVGLVLFNLADASVQPNMDKTGILLISLALCADAIIGNIQEKAMNKYSSSTVEMVVYSYSIGILYLFIWTAISGALLPAFYYCLENPRMYLMIAILSLSGYIGVNFVLATINYFGALMAVTVTTFRKSITMVLSFVFFTKPFTQQYVWSGLIVLLGILLNVYAKNSDRVNKWLSVELKYLWVKTSSGKLIDETSFKLEVPTLPKDTTSGAIVESKDSISRAKGTMNLPEYISNDVHDQASSGIQPVKVEIDVLTSTTADKKQQVNKLRLDENSHLR